MGDGLTRTYSGPEVGFGEVSNILATWWAGRLRNDNVLYHALFRLRSNPPIKLVISGGRLFGKWCIRDDIGKVGGCVPLDISNAEIPNDVVKGGRRLPPNDVAKAIFESVF